MCKNKYLYNNHVNNTKISANEKSKKVRLIMIEYKKAKIERQYSSLFSENKKYRKEQQEHYINYIDEIINSLSKESKEFIIKEYIESNNDSKWRMNVYRRSTYYKVRESALNEFLLYVI